MLAYERIGTGEPLLLLHGIAHRRQAWQPVVDRLAEHRELILVDLPGHGESPSLKPWRRNPSEAIREELLAFIDEQGLDRPHVAGNSIGARFALELAEAGAVRSCTLLSPGGFWYSRVDFLYTLGLFGTVMSVGTVLSPLARRLTATRAGRAFLFFWLYGKPTRPEPDLAYGDYRGLLRARPALLRFITEGAPYKGTVGPDVPVTIGWGTRDLVLPRYQARVARKRLPGAELTMLPGCGHVPMGDDPERVADLILKGSS
ncbi:alpha/beta fold hydrolase [Streptomyces sp. B1866]|uniref:alpha/beta fold hydrolase n=1 Tax=Streptomyces sp. B1866 TaxID=3075431 RepID=UPI00289196AB|nr:alpha/beta fold hydrolase [Streptomyces sp. B1866]MDT3395070.1 alpha/beta fold hydrolase [Streptomyces sp. B1866]